MATSSSHESGGEFDDESIHHGENKEGYHYESYLGADLDSLYEGEYDEDDDSSVCSSTVNRDDDHYRDDILFPQRHTNRTISFIINANKNDEYSDDLADDLTVDSIF